MKLFEAPDGRSDLGRCAEKHRPRCLVRHAPSRMSPVCLIACTPCTQPHRAASPFTPAGDNGNTYTQAHSIGLRRQNRHPDQKRSRSPPCTRRPQKSLCNPSFGSGERSRFEYFYPWTLTDDPIRTRRLDTKTPCNYPNAVSTCVRL